MNTVARWLFSIVFFCMANLSSAANLPSGWTLSPGQGVYSDDGRYLLTMQSDGNLVYYRTSDWAVRWYTNTAGLPGTTLTMQGDGNAVTYYTPPVILPGKGGVPQYQKETPATYATWWSNTSGFPGAILTAENNGDLVVYHNGQALWSIGDDPATRPPPPVPEPQFMGDAVGREMESNMPYSFLGHIGFFDGGNIYEVLNDGAPNAAAYNSVDEFKRRAFNGYWGGASPSIPDYFVWGCYKPSCRDGNDNQTLAARWMMVLRANQIWQIGVDYTYITYYTRAEPNSRNHQPIRGVYRCDTYVLDVYADNGIISDANGTELSVDAIFNWPALARWINFRANDLNGNLSLVTPLTIFNKLKSFTG